MPWPATLPHLLPFPYLSDWYFYGLELLYTKTGQARLGIFSLYGDKGYGSITTHNMPYSINNHIHLGDEINGFTYKSQ